MKKSRLLSCLLVFIMVVSMITGVTPVQAATSGDYTYDDNGDGTTCTITGYAGAGGNVTIPPTLGGLRVTAIGNAAFSGEFNDSCAALTSVTIPDGVTSIGENAFSCCYILTTIEIPASVISIGRYAFDGCESLTSVTIPDSVTSIGSYAFNGCTSLESVTIPDSVTSIEEGTFYDCTSLKSVTIPANLASIGENAFNCCKNLTTIEIPDSVTFIGSYAFDGCESLTSVTIPDSVTSIEEGAFIGCTSLTSVTIPDSVTSIKEGAFECCEKLTGVTLPANLASIGGFVFCSCTGLTGSITIPASVTSIGENAFNNCSSLTGVTIADGVESIGDGAFAKTGLTGSITIPASVTSIAKNAFYECHKLTGINVDAGNQNYSSMYGILYDKDQSDLLFCPLGLTSVTIPYGVTSIMSYAFFYCSDLTSVTIPASVLSIAKDAFCHCPNLSSVYFDGDPTMTAGLDTFTVCSDSLAFFCPTENSGHITLTPLTEVTTKPITVAAAVYDYITPSTYSGMPGEAISLNIKPAAGYVLQTGSLKYTDGSDHAINGTSFTMPDANVTVSAEFEEPPATTYNVNIGSLSGGSITANPASATAGTTINLTITPDSGKQLKSGTLKYNDGTQDKTINGTSFTMSAANVTVSAEFEAIPPATIVVTGVTLNKTSTSIEKGSSETLAATVVPADATNKNVSWSSDQPGIASVDQTAKVTAVAAGTATITVTTTDGNKTAACQVTVTESATTVTASTDQTIPISGSANITIPQGVTGTKIDIDPANPLPLIKVNASTALGTIQAEIPAGTTVSGPAGWNGEITLPTVKASPSATITGAQTVDTVIEVGLGNETIKFSKAVRLLIPNMAGKSAGFVRNGVFTPITATISADSQSVADAEIPDGGEAKINVGNDLVIWTKHFTEFVAYTPRSSGGSGGGAYVSQPVNTTTGSATVYPTAGGKIGLGSDVIVEIPANALQGTSGVTVKVQKVESPSSIPEGFKQGSDVFEFTVDGKTSYSFNKPVTITLNLNTTADAIPAIYYYDSQSSKWIKVGGTVSGSTISVSVDHFTKYTVMAENQTQPTTANQPNSFTDLDKHWAKQSIEKLAGLGAVSGYPDGSFKPDASITRAEFVTILLKALKLTAGGNGPVFKDTAGHWASAYISIAAESGLISGYGDNCFKPDSLITREEMAVAAVKAAKLSQASGENSFTDNLQISSWAKGSVLAAVNASIIKGYPDNTFRPQGQTTRAEAVMVISHLIK